MPIRALKEPDLDDDVRYTSSVCAMLSANLAISTRVLWLATMEQTIVSIKVHKAVESLAHCPGIWQVERLLVPLPLEKVHRTDQ